MSLSVLFLVVKYGNWQIKYQEMTLNKQASLHVLKLSQACSKREGLLC